MNVRVRENSYFDTQEYYQKINSAAAETMQIACVIFQDMLIHVFGLPEDHANVMWGQTENGSPAFAFVCPDGYHEKFEAF